MTLEMIKTEERYMGQEEGIEQGLQQGAYQKAIEIAKILLQMNLSTQQIIKATGLTSKEIEEL